MKKNALVSSNAILYCDVHYYVIPSQPVPTEVLIGFTRHGRGL